MASRLTNLAKNLALSAASLGLCVLLAEGVLRLCGFGNVEIYEPDPVLFWRLKPNQDCYTKVDHKPVHINAHGTRGPEFDAAKPPGTIRVLSLGDSKTFGWGLTEAETYSNLLERGLRAHSSKPVQVINAGVNAWSYSQMRAYLKHRALAFQPDFVVLADGNLWTQFTEATDPEFVRQFLLRVRLKNLLRRSAIYHYVIEVQLKEFYDRYRTKFIPVDPKQDTLFKEQQQSDPDAVFRDAIQGLCELALTNGVRPVLLYIPILTDLEAGRTNRIALLKRGIAERLQLPFLDFTADIAPGGAKLYLDADPVHLNAEGNRIVAQRLVETLRPRLPR